MEAVFNTDYNNLLAEAEKYARRKSETTYKQLIALALVGDISSSLEARGLVDGLINDIYNKADSLYRTWYMDSFDHLAIRGKEEIDLLYGDRANKLAELRALAIAPIMVRTTELLVKNNPTKKTVEDFGHVPSGMANRTAITETNSAVGGIIESTALAMFGGSGLFKRWLTVGDERVRHTHSLVASRPAIPMTGLYQVGNVFMRYPADPSAFGGNVAREVVNCRCRSLILPISTGQPNSQSLNQFLGAPPNVSL